MNKTEYIWLSRGGIGGVPRFPTASSTGRGSAPMGKMSKIRKSMHPLTKLNQ
jgi:hypothetical protein